MIVITHIFAKRAAPVAHIYTYGSGSDYGWTEIVLDKSAVTRTVSVGSKISVTVNQVSQITRAAIEKSEVAREVSDASLVTIVVSQICPVTTEVFALSEVDG